MGVSGKSLGMDGAHNAIPSRVCVYAICCPRASFPRTSSIESPSAWDASLRTNHVDLPNINAPTSPFIAPSQLNGTSNRYRQHYSRLRMTWNTTSKPLRLRHAKEWRACSHNIVASCTLPTPVSSLQNHPHKSSAQSTPPK